MTRPFISLIVLLVFCLSVFPYENRRDDSILLNGIWEYAVGEGDEGVGTEAGEQNFPWRQVTLPGPFMAENREAANQTKFVWARRRFTVTPTQAEGLAVLRWNRIACGAEAFINGQKVGENEPTGPYQVIVPAGVLRSGENQIVLNIRGAAGVRRSKSGNPLIPAGFGVELPAVTDDVWIDFADSAYMKWVLALPNLDGSRVKIRVTPVGLHRMDDLTLIARVKPWPDGEVLGEGQAPARLVPDPDPLGGEHFIVEVPMPDFQPWTHEQNPLYLAQVELIRQEQVLDKLTFRFGMREIEVKDGNYKLNGKNLWLRGSNLVFEWNWGVINGKEKDYLVTEAREMSMNSFRTHTQPPPRLWADICDEYGTMILAEFPCLYNYADYKFTPEEYEIWHKNVLTDAAGWMSQLWNHPSVIMWVLSNESTQDNDWESGPYRDFVATLDPTRPTLRTGTTGTQENYDVHTCGNIIETAEGHLQPQIPSWFKESGKRTTTNTEYMNIFDRPPTQWVGREDPAADQLAVAQIGMEHTEAMRRARLDGIWPYMYAGWTKTRRLETEWAKTHGGAEWKAGYATPLSACWHSSLSSVLSSLDLFDANYLCGQQVATDLYLINDSWHDENIHVDILLTKECPEMIPEADCFKNPLSQGSYDFSLKADRIEQKSISWQIPEEEGEYWLTARTTGMSGRPVLSQRFVRALRKPVVSDSLKHRNYILVGSDTSAEDFFQSKGLTYSTQLNDPDPEKDFIIIWNMPRLSHEEKQYTEAIQKYLQRGGTVVILAATEWNWKELCDVNIVASNRYSRVFPYEGLNHPILSDINLACLQRWNGYPGTVAVSKIEGPALEKAQKILWAREPGETVLVEIPGGKGKILFSVLDIQSHLPSSNSLYDPIAEKLLINMLSL